jgi:hypothetical protein
MVKMARPVLKVRKASKVFKGYRAVRECPVHLVMMAVMVMMVRPVHKVRKASKGFKEYKAK